MEASIVEKFRRMDAFVSRTVGSSLTTTDGGENFDVNRAYPSWETFWAGKEKSWSRLSRSINSLSRSTVYKRIRSLLFEPRVRSIRRIRREIRSKAGSTTVGFVLLSSFDLSLSLSSRRLSPSSLLRCTVEL